VPIGLRMEFGNGETPPISLPARPVRRVAKTSGRAAAKSTARRSTRARQAGRKK
jgi:hypothetical protein